MADMVGKGAGAVLAGAAGLAERVEGEDWGEGREPAGVRLQAIVVSAVAEGGGSPGRISVRGVT